MAPIATDNKPRRPGSPDTDMIIDSNAQTTETTPSSSQPEDQAHTPPQHIQIDTSSPRSRSRSAVRLLKALSPTLTLKNSGSVARDHLASERTWLAYVRTSLAIASTGVGE